MQPARIRDVGEFPLIERLARRLRGVGRPLPLGVGDDAAILPAVRRGRSLLTKDLLVEGVHFRRETVPPRALGFKALEVSLSDVAAMGARPVAFFLGLSLPADYLLSDFDALAGGVRASARRADVALGGGDTSCSPGPVMISVSVVATLSGRALRRDGARCGDLLAVSGPLGASATGLRLLEEGWRWRDGGVSGPASDPVACRHARTALRAHLFPRARLDVGRAAARISSCRAAIDLSDGLASDLAHLCARSRVGARVERRRVPVAACARYWARCWKIDPWALAVRGGEDYQLLLALGAGALRAWSRRRKPPAPRIIGRVVPARQGLREVGPDGSLTAWGGCGFRHFT